MRKSKLETDKITLRDIFEEIKYVGLKHYFDDLTGVLIGMDMHYHKKNHTSKDNLLIHSQF